MILTIITGLLNVSGCSTEKLDVCEGYIGPYEYPIEVNEPAPFGGVLVSSRKYEYMVRCQNYIEQNNIAP